MATYLEAKLRLSGIKYAGWVPKEKRNTIRVGAEMVDDIDPLQVLREEENAGTILNRIMQTEFFSGLVDTYNVLVGRHFDFDVIGKGRKGVLDILLFPLLSRWLIGYAAGRLFGTDKEGPEHKPSAKDIGLAFVAGIPGILLEIPRHVLGVFFTIALSPVVLLVHFVSAFFSCICVEENEMMQTESSKPTNNDAQKNEEKQTLADHLRQADSSIKMRNPHHTEDGNTLMGFGAVKKESNAPCNNKVTIMKHFRY